MSGTAMVNHPIAAIRTWNRCSPVDLSLTRCLLFVDMRKAMPMFRSGFGFHTPSARQLWEFDMVFPAFLFELPFIRHSVLLSEMNLLPVNKDNLDTLANYLLQTKDNDKSTRSRGMFDLLQHHPHWDSFREPASNGGAWRIWRFAGSYDSRPHLCLGSVQCGGKLERLYLPLLVPSCAHSNEYTTNINCTRRTKIMLV